MRLKKHIENLLDKGNSTQAIEELTILIKNRNATQEETGPLASTNPPTDELHHLIGNAYYKIGNWKEAIQHYLEACEINNNSPAKEKLKMTYSILEFYNKDVYGQ